MSIKSKFITYYKNLRVSLSARENPMFMWYYQYLHHPKKESLAELISVYSLEKKPDKFTVIQVGANDGITNDPIHKFIKRDRWVGVLLEPQPYVYSEYLKPIYQKNEGIIPICAAVGKEHGKAKLYKIAFSDMRWASGLSSLSKESVKESFANGVVEKNCKKFGIEIPERQEDQIGFEWVDIISPETIMNKYSIRKIDLLLIDAEGFDLQVIEMFDIPKIQPRAIIFENINLHPTELEKCYSELKSEGYLLKEFGRDTIAMKNPSFEIRKLLS